MNIPQVSSRAPSTQPLLSLFMMRARRFLGTHLFNQRIGRVAGRLLSERIPHRGLTITTTSPLVTDDVRTALLLGAYESAEYRFVQRFIPTDADVIELGASIGVMTCHLRKMVDRAQRVIAVEADARLLPLIAVNLAENCDEPVIVLNKIVSYGEEKHVAFSCGDDSLGGRAGIGTSPMTQLVEAVTLADLVSRYSCGSFSLVSDIEGAEWDLWRNERATLTRSRCCVFELHDSPEGEPAQSLLAAIEQDPAFELLGRYGPVVAFRPIVPRIA